MRIRFEEVSRPVTKQVPCRVCGKKLSRSTTLAQTISPFNKDTAGNQKTKQQILAELREQAKTWQPTNDICAGCRDVETAGAL